jgi:Immunoglobulin-like domain of bacterial spore germination
VVPHPPLRLFLILALAASACQLQIPTPIAATPSPAPGASVDLTPDGTAASIETNQAPQTPSPAPDYVDEMRNAHYQLGTPDSLQIVQLVDGEFEQGAPGSTDYISVRVTEFVSSGDLNADGIDEIVALISENYGGTGVFVFLAVYGTVNGELAFQTSAIVDDRPQLNALSIENNEIFLDATIHGAEEPLCCPTLRTTRHYRLAESGQLEMIDYTTFTPDGRPRTITIESPVDGTEVFSSFQIRGTVAIAPFENNLTYSIEDIGGVELARGAISISAPELGASGTFDAVVPLGNILSGALIRVEVQDISAADGSLFAMDSVELVVK